MKNVAVRAAPSTPVSPYDAPPLPPLPEWSPHAVVRRTSVTRRGMPELALPQQWRPGRHTRGCNPRIGCGRAGSSAPGRVAPPVAWI